MIVLGVPPFQETPTSVWKPQAPSSKFLPSTSGGWNLKLQEQKFNRRSVGIWKKHTWWKNQLKKGGRTIPRHSTRWWQLKYFFIFTPKIGEDSQLDEHIFQRGWFNHQLVLYDISTCIYHMIHQMYRRDTLNVYRVFFAWRMTAFNVMTGKLKCRAIWNCSMCLDGKTTRWWFHFFYFHPYLGKIPILTNIFQRGWNHQLDKPAGHIDTQTSYVWQEITLSKWAFKWHLSMSNSGVGVTTMGPPRNLHF